MATLKLLSAALFAAAVIAAPAMARQHHVTSRHSTDSVPAPRVGSFAGQPWDNDVPCEPWTGAAY